MKLDLRLTTSFYKALPANIADIKLHLWLVINSNKGDIHIRPCTLDLKAKRIYLEIPEINNIQDLPIDFYDQVQAAIIIVLVCV